MYRFERLWYSSWGYWVRMGFWPVLAALAVLKALAANVTQCLGAVGFGVAILLYTASASLYRKYSRDTLRPQRKAFRLSRGHLARGITKLVWKQRPALLVMRIDRLGSGVVVQIATLLEAYCHSAVRMYFIQPGTVNKGALPGYSRIQKNIPVPTEILKWQQQPVTAREMWTLVGYLRMWKAHG